MKRMQLTAAVALLAIAASYQPVAVHAAPYLLPNVPLIVSVRSIPNIWFQLDDSGSMDWEVLAGSHYTACSYDSMLRCSDSGFQGEGKILDWNGSFNNYRASMYTFEYVFDGASDHAYGSSCPPSGEGSGSTLRECEKNVTDGTVHYSDGQHVPYRQDWRARSADLNVMFFNPDAEYVPWAPSNTSFMNASFAAARSWPVPGETGYSATRNLAGFHYHYWIDDKGFKGAAPEATADSVSNTPNGIVDEWDSFIRVTLTSGSSFSCEKVTHDPKTYFWNSSVDNELRGLNPSTTALPVNDPQCILATGGQSASSLALNAANWYQYYRRRTHVMRGAVGMVVDELPEFRYGTGNINQTSSNYPIPNSAIKDYDINNRKLMDVLYGTNRQQAGTPLRAGLKWVGDYYEGDHKGLPSPIIEACQKNFTLLFSDGFWNRSTPGGIGDVDRDRDRISDSSTTLADVARYYYNKDLSGSLANSVPTDAFDAANWQHMVTYTINFGLKGALVDSDGDGWPNPPLKINDDWTKSGVSDLDKVDDMWHAAWNARGAYFAADNPQDLVKSVSSVVADIGNRFGGAASAAANSGSISSESKIFQAKFDTIDWHGELLAFPVSDEGTIEGAATWNANEILSSKSDGQLRANGSGARNVFTWNNDGATTGGTPFHWSSISSDQKAHLNRSPDGVIDSKGSARLEYIRGVAGQLPAVFLFLRRLLPVFQRTQEPDGHDLLRRQRRHVSRGARIGRRRTVRLRTRPRVPQAVEADRPVLHPRVLRRRPARSRRRSDQQGLADRRGQRAACRRTGPVRARRDKPRQLQFEQRAMGVQRRSRCRSRVHLRPTADQAHGQRQVGRHNRQRPEQHRSRRQRLDHR